jgi:hypothetical protein
VKRVGHIIRKNEGKFLLTFNYPLQRTARSIYFGI